MRERYEQKKPQKITWYSWNLDGFSNMYPLMPKGDIFSMNVDDTTLGEFPEH